MAIVVIAQASAVSGDAAPAKWAATQSAAAVYIAREFSGMNAK